MYQDKKYGPNEITDQGSRKNTAKWWRDSQPIRCKLQNTGNQEAHRNVWVWSQNRGRSEGYAKWKRDEHYNLRSNSDASRDHWCFKSEKMDQKAMCASWWCPQRTLSFKGKQWNSVVSVFWLPVASWNRPVDFVILFMEGIGRKISEIKPLLIIRKVYCD